MKVKKLNTLDATFDADLEAFAANTSITVYAAFVVGSNLYILYMD